MLYLPSLGCPPTDMVIEGTINLPALQASDKALAALVEVTLDQQTIEMVGGSQTSTHYSLPGRVNVTFPALPLSFGGQYRLLHALEITFEGKSEYWDEDGRYSPLRLHSVTVPLITTTMYTVQPFCPDDSALKLTFEFDLNVPGWLPPTLMTRHASTAYGVVATATIGWANESIFTQHSSFTPLQYSNGEMVLARLSRSAFSPVTIRRHRLPTAVSQQIEMRQQSFAFRSKALPLDIFINHAEWADLHSSDGVRVEMYMRSQYTRSPESRKPTDEEGPTAESETLPDHASSTTFGKHDTVAWLSRMAMEIEEREEFRSIPSHVFRSSFPLPAEQPTIHGEHMLLGPSHVPMISRPMFPGMVEPARRKSTKRCLVLPTGKAQGFSFPEARKVNGTWRKVKGALHLSLEGAQCPQPDSSSAFVRVTHHLKTHVTFRLPDGSEVTETYKTPIRLGTSPETFPAPLALAPPPYIRVFHENGEVRDCDPLPLYTEADDCVGEVDNKPLSLHGSATPSCASMRSAAPSPEPAPAPLESSSSPTASPRPAAAQLHGSETDPMDLDADADSAGPSSSRRSAAAELSSASRKLFEQWARETSLALEAPADSA